MSSPAKSGVYFIAIVTTFGLDNSHILPGKSYDLYCAQVNVPNIIGQITSVIAESGTNISEMVNKSRDGIAYNMIDLDQDLDQSTVEKLLAVDGVIRVRQLPYHDLS